jgi:hypothetical protein
MKTNKDQRKKYTLMKRYDMVWTQIKAKTKIKSSSRKRRTPGEIVRMRNWVFFANENEYVSSKGNLLGSNYLLQQTKQTNKEN